MQTIQQVGIIFSGFTFREGIQTSETGKLSLIQTKNMEELTDLDSLTNIDIFPNYERYLLQDQDILIVSKGITNSVRMLNIHEDTPLIIATAAFIVIRTNKDIVDPAFLTWYLQLQETQELLKSYQRKSTVPNLSIKAIQELNIPILPLERQQKLGELHQLHQKRKQIIATLEKKRSILIDTQLSKIIGNA